MFDRTPDKSYSKHDTDLSTTVEAGRHALSIDERRCVFMPTLWRNVRDLNTRAGKDHYAEDAPFQQKWFAGDHGSVGGGGPERGLSNAALHWVLRGAIDQGLDVRIDGRSQLRDIRYRADAPLRNTPLEGGSLLGLAWMRLKAWALTGYRSGPDEIDDVHPSALRRWFLPVERLPEGHPYRPKPLDRVAGEINALRDTFVPMETKSDAQIYTVELNDTLGRIARTQLGDSSRYLEIFEMNRDTLDSPHDVFPGEALRLPPAEPIGETANPASP